MNEIPPMKILICVSMIPWPVADGLSVRIFNLSKELARRHEVHMFCLSTSPPSAAQEQGIAAAGIKLTVVSKPAMSLPARAATYLRDLAKGIPLELILSWEDRAMAAITELHRRNHYDAVMAEHLFMGRFVLKAGCPRLLDEHNVEGRLMADLARREKPPRRWFRQLSAIRIGACERKLLRSMQAITAVTEADARVFTRDAPGVPVAVVRNGVSSADYQAGSDEKPQRGHSLLFVGLMSYMGNAEAAEWFTARVLPLIRERYSDATLALVGKDPLPQVTKLGDGDGITVTGFVDDVRPYYRDSAVMVVPLLMGGGSRLKILEAFAAGAPVVSTAKGAEGLEVEDGVHLLLADGPEDFAAAVVRLLGDEELCRSLKSNARRLVEEKYDWSVLAGSLESALAVAAGKAGAGR